MDSECNNDMLEEASYQLVFGFPEKVDYQVQKLISNLNIFKTFGVHIRMWIVV